MIYNKEIFVPFVTADNTYYCAVNLKGRQMNFELDSKEFELEFRTIYRQNFNKQISGQKFEPIREEMRLDAYSNKLDYNLETRISIQEDGSIVYRLEPEGDTSVWVHDGMVELIETPTMQFKKCASMCSQVLPDLDIDERKLPKLLKRHFHLKKRYIFILSLYLPCAFAGNEIGHPILMLSGSKGSGKSQVARGISTIVDPQDAALVAIPKNRDDLALRLHNNYMVILDNILSTNRSLSDMLALAVTGGSYTRRALYKNTEEILLSLRTLIVMTGTDIACRENDILDRSILLILERLNPEEIKPEENLNDSFLNDLPSILGCCFKLLAKALNDEEPVTVPKTRMADSFELMIRIGRALGYEDEKTSQFLWANQSEINSVAISDDVVGACLIEFMQTRDEFQGSVTELLCELKEISLDNGIDRSIFPKQPNVLSRKLNSLKSNLEQEYGLFFDIKNTGAFREITIWWNDGE